MLFRSPADKCSGLEFDGNITISGFSGNGYNCDRAALNVHGNSILSGDACVGTGSGIVFDVTESQSLFFNNVKIQNNKNLTVDNDVSLSGILRISGHQPLLWSESVPSSSSSNGAKGTVAFDNTGIYFCINDNTWRVTQSYIF